MSPVVVTLVAEQRLSKGETMVGHHQLMFPRLPLPTTPPPPS